MTIGQELVLYLVGLILIPDLTFTKAGAIILALGIIGASSIVGLQIFLDSLTANKYYDKIEKVL